MDIGIMLANEPHKRVRVCTIQSCTVISLGGIRASYLNARGVTGLFLARLLLLGNGEGSARGAVAVAVRAQASRDPSECEQMMLSVQPAPNSESF